MLLLTLLQKESFLLLFFGTGTKYQKSKVRRNSILFNRFLFDFRFLLICPGFCDFINRLEFFRSLSLPQSAVFFNHCGREKGVWMNRMRVSIPFEQEGALLEPTICSFFVLFETIFFVTTKILFVIHRYPIIYRVAKVKICIKIYVTSPFVFHFKLNITTWIANASFCTRYWVVKIYSAFFLYFCILIFLRSHGALQSISSHFSIYLMSSIFKAQLGRSEF